jgi:hypothetical protein
MLASCLAYFSTLEMEAICYSETLNDFHQTTQHYIPEDRTLQCLRGSERCAVNLQREWFGVYCICLILNYCYFHIIECEWNNNCCFDLFLNMLSLFLASVSEWEIFLIKAFSSSCQYNLHFYKMARIRPVKI